MSVSALVIAVSECSFSDSTYAYLNTFYKLNLNENCVKVNVFNAKLKYVYFHCSTIFRNYSHDNGSANNVHVQHFRYVRLSRHANL